MSHPTSCHDPNCTLSYRDHLTTISLSSDALPTRRPDAHQTNARERRWNLDMASFDRLHKEGHTPAQIDGAHLRETRGESRWDVTERPVHIDYTSPGGDSFGYPEKLRNPEELGIEFKS